MINQRIRKKIPSIYISAITAKVPICVITESLIYSKKPESLVSYNRHRS